MFPAAFCVVCPLARDLLANCLMKFSLPTSLAFLLGSTFLVACGDDSASGSGGAGGAGTTSGSTTQGTTTGGTTTSASSGGDGGSGGAGGTGSGGDGGGGAPACTGDAEAWDGIQKTDIACESHGDCCVVVNGCIAQAVVVGVNDFESAQELWPTCEGDCVDCFVPYLEVLCGESGFCEAYADDVEFAPPASSKCGSDDPAPGNNGPGEAFDCSGVPI